VPRSWAERAYPKLIHYNKIAKAVSFALLSRPNFFRKIRVAQIVAVGFFPERRKCAMPDHSS